MYSILVQQVLQGEDTLINKNQHTFKIKRRSQQRKI